MAGKVSPSRSIEDTGSMPEPQKPRVPGSVGHSLDLTILNSPVGSWDFTGPEEAIADWLNSLVGFNKRMTEVRGRDCGLQMEEHIPGYGGGQTSFPSFLLFMEDGHLGIPGGKPGPYF